MHRRPWRRPWWVSRLPSRTGSGSRWRAQLALEALESRELLTTYFISPSGDDGNDGTSMASPWESIRRVNQGTYQAGDAILFQGGASFRGNLIFNAQDQGTAINPIIVSSYGEGKAALTSASGVGLGVVDAAGFDITNLVVAGPGIPNIPGDGIAFENTLARTTLEHIRIDNVEVYGFSSLGTAYGGWGIYFVGSEPQSNYRDITITNTSVHDNGMGGIRMIDTILWPVSAENITIDHVWAYHNPGLANYPDGTGFGVLLINVHGALVDHSEAYANGYLADSGGGGGGIGAISSSRVVIQNSEAYDNQSPDTFHDGDGFFLDSVYSSALQYNYAHDNDGAGFLVCTCDANHQGANNVVRFNISESDSRTNSYAGIYVFGPNPIPGTEVYNNTVYMSAPRRGVTAGIVAAGGFGHFRNNIIQTTRDVPVLSVTAAGSDLIFQGNDYWSGGDTVMIDWLGTTYPTLDAWRLDTLQETYNGAEVGFQTDPMLTDAGHGGTIGDPDLLNTLSAYRLQSSSPLRNAGLDLTADFGINPGPRNFYGDPVPPLNIGAD